VPSEHRLRSHHRRSSARDCRTIGSLVCRLMLPFRAFFEVDWSCADERCSCDAPNAERSSGVAACERTGTHGE
jgi:hypothetical protein